MNKTEIKRALEKKRDKRLLEIKENYEAIKNKNENCFVQESCGLELTNMNTAISDLKSFLIRSKFLDTYKEIKVKVEKTEHLRQLSYSDKRDMFEQLETIIDGTFEYDVYETVNSYTGRKESKKLYEEYQSLSKAITREYERLFAYLTSTTAKKFLDFCIDNKIEIDLVEIVNEKTMLPAPKFNFNLLQ